MLLAVLYTFGLAVWQILVATGAAGWWPLRLISLFDIWLFLPLPFLLLLAWLRRQRWALVVLLLPVLMLAFNYGDRFLPRAQGEAGQSLRVMTANLLAGNAEIDAFGAMVLRERPDVLAVQELTPALARSLEAQIGQEYPFTALYPNEANPSLGLGIFSRLPLRDRSPALTGPDSCRCQQVTLDYAGQSVAVLNAHPTRPRMTFHIVGPLPVPTSFDTNGRDRALQALSARVRATAGPLVVLGDFNLGDREPQYRLLTEDLHDAYRVAGWGLGYTFPNQNLDELLLGRGVARLPYFPLVRIDYAFFSDGWAATGARVVGAPGSDHLAVVADLRLQAQGAAPR